MKLTPEDEAAIAEVREYIDPDAFSDFKPHDQAERIRHWAEYRDLAAGREDGRVLPRPPPVGRSSSTRCSPEVLSRVLVRCAGGLLPQVAREASRHH